LLRCVLNDKGKDLVVCSQLEDVTIDKEIPDLAALRSDIEDSEGPMTKAFL
jgi:hypothetical protein